MQICYDDSVRSAWLRRRAGPGPRIRGVGPRGSTTSWDRGHEGADDRDDEDGRGGGSGGAQWAGWASQLQELTERNGALLSALDAKDDQIADLETRLLAAESGGGGAVGDSDPRDLKIMELAKRNRALNLAVQRQKDM